MGTRVNLVTDIKKEIFRKEKNLYICEHNSTGCHLMAEIIPDT